MYSAGGTEDTQSEREGQRERLVANQTHLKTAPSGPRHELSAMVKFMRRMQQQYVQQQRQQQQQLAVEQNQSDANSTLSLLAPHGIQKGKGRARPAQAPLFTGLFYGIRFGK